MYAHIYTHAQTRIAGTHAWDARKRAYIDMHVSTRTLMGMQVHEHTEVHARTNECSARTSNASHVAEDLVVGLLQSRGGAGRGGGESLGPRSRVPLCPLMHPTLLEVFIHCHCLAPPLPCNCLHRYSPPALLQPTCPATARLPCYSPSSLLQPAIPATARLPCYSPPALLQPASPATASVSLTHTCQGEAQAALKPATTQRAQQAGRHTTTAAAARCGRSGCSSSSSGSILLLFIPFLTSRVIIISSGHATAPPPAGLVG